MARKRSRPSADRRLLLADDVQALFAALQHELVRVPVPQVAELIETIPHPYRAYFVDGMRTVFDIVEDLTQQLEESEDG